MKLGGSVLTDKGAYRSARADVLARLAREIASSNEPIIVVHGAGSFGHVLAKRHGLIDGDDGSPGRRLAFSQVIADVRDLDSLVRAALREAGVPATPHSSLDLASLRDGKLVRFDEGPVVRALAAKFTPVLRGDGCLDETRGYGILSGDLVMVELARTLNPTRVVFVTDVDGIFDRDPRQGGAKLLAQVDARVDVGEGAAQGADVTGGMRGKLDRAAAIARFGAETLIVNGLEPGRLADALSGKSVVGTRVIA